MDRCCIICSRATPPEEVFYTFQSTVMCLSCVMESRVGSVVQASIKEECLARLKQERTNKWISDSKRSGSGSCGQSNPVGRL